MHRIIIFIFRRLPNSNSLIIPRAPDDHAESPMAHLSLSINLKHICRKHFGGQPQSAKHQRWYFSLRLRERKKFSVKCAKQKEQNSTPLINTWAARPRRASAKVSLAAVRAAKLIDAIIAHPFHFTRGSREKKRREANLFIDLWSLVSRVGAHQPRTRTWVTISL